MRDEVGTALRLRGYDMNAASTSLERNAAWPILILNGRRGRGVVSVVPQGLRRAAVASGTGPAGRSYDMDAVFMSFQQHGSGNHAVPARCRRGERGRSPFPAAPWLLASHTQTKINLS